VHARVALKFLAPVALVVAFVLPLASAGASPVSDLKAVSQDNIVDGLGLHHSETQSSLASAVGSQTVVSAFEVGRIFDGGSSAIGWSTSTNGGGPLAEAYCRIRSRAAGRRPARSSRSTVRPTRTLRTTRGIPHGSSRAAGWEARAASSASS